MLQVLRVAAYKKSAAIYQFCGGVLPYCREELMAMASEWEKITRGGGCDQETKRPGCVGTVEVKASFIYTVRKRVYGEVEGRAPGPFMCWLPRRGLREG